MDLIIEKKQQSSVEHSYSANFEHRMQNDEANQITVTLLDGVDEFTHKCDTVFEWYHMCAYHRLTS